MDGESPGSEFAPAGCKRSSRVYFVRRPFLAREHADERVGWLRLRIPVIPVSRSGGIRSLIPKESERVHRLMTLDGDWSL